jgi:hypothetical protein
MSQTISIGVVGASHWTYMATVMAEWLEQFIKTNKPEDEIPKGVYKSALRFFDLVLQAANGTVPTNPLASINAYLIAADAIAGSTHSHTSTRHELRSRLEEFKLFLDQLPTTKKLDKHTKSVAIALEEFFNNLADEGEAESYEQNVRFEDPLSEAQRRNPLALSLI